MPILAFVDAAAAVAAAPGVASAVGLTAPKAMTPATALVAMLLSRKCESNNVQPSNELVLVRMRWRYQVMAATSDDAQTAAQVRESGA